MTTLPLARVTEYGSLTELVTAGLRSTRSPTIPASEDPAPRSIQTLSPTSRRPVDVPPKGALAYYRAEVAKRL
jgi:hypothetical protein